jgi:cytochrome c-type biogenesis protein CcmH
MTPGTPPPPPQTTSGAFPAHSADIAPLDSSASTTCRRQPVERCISRAERGFCTARRRRGLRAGAALLAVAAALAVPTAALAKVGAPSQHPAPKTTLPDVEDEVMCPICGTALNLSFSPQADRERAFIQHEINEGKTKEQIKADLVTQYGTNVLAEPPKSGFDLTAWLVPGIAILVAATAIALGLWRWRRAGRAREATATPEGTLDASERERLDSDLSRYDL